jgi:hypothetical protein
MAGANRTLCKLSPSPMCMHQHLTHRHEPLFQVRMMLGCTLTLCKTLRGNRTAAGWQHAISHTFLSRKAGETSALGSRRCRRSRVCQHILKSQHPSKFTTYI